MAWAGWGAAWRPAGCKLPLARDPAHWLAIAITYTSAAMPRCLVATLAAPAPPCSRARAPARLPPVLCFKPCRVQPPRRRLAAPRPPAAAAGGAGDEAGGSAAGAEEAAAQQAMRAAAVLAADTFLRVCVVESDGSVGLPLVWSVRALLPASPYPAPAAAANFWGIPFAACRTKSPSGLAPAQP